MTKISRVQIEVLRKEMEAELAQLVDDTQDEMNVEQKRSFVDIDNDVADTADEAFADTIVDIDNAVIGLHLQKARDLNAALNRIQMNVYGVCIDCNNGIDFERLAAYPSAKRCIKCQSLHEKTFVSAPKPSY